MVRTINIPKKGDIMCDDYEFIKKINSGSFGSVYEVQKKGTKQKYALKKYHYVLNEDGILSDVLKELNILSRINFNYAIKAEQLFISKVGDVCLILPLADNNLTEYLDLVIIEPKRKLNNSDRLRLSWEISCGLCELHMNDIIHTDLKPDNILMFGNKPKISDLDGIILPAGKIKWYEVTTVTFRAPELFLHKDFTKKIDIWSLGCIIYNLYTDKNIFVFAECQSNEECYDVIVKKIQNISSNQFFMKIPKSVQNLLLKMLVIEPEKRCTIQDVMNDPIFKVISVRCDANNTLFNNAYQVQGVNIYELSEQDKKLRTNIIREIKRTCDAMYGDNKIQSYNVFFTAVDIFDRIFQSNKQNIWLKLGLTAISLSSKILETPYDKDKFYMVFPESYDELEGYICDTLKFQLYRKTFYSLYPEKAECWVKFVEEWGSMYVQDFIDRN